MLRGPSRHLHPQPAAKRLGMIAVVGPFSLAAAGKGSERLSDLQLGPRYAGAPECSPPAPAHMRDCQEPADNGASILYRGCPHWRVSFAFGLPVPEGKVGKGESQQVKGQLLRSICLHQCMRLQSDIGPVASRLLLHGHAMTTCCMLLVPVPLHDDPCSGTTLARVKHPSEALWQLHEHL